ncbi:MAG: efflux RND transporter periplasmic adaptor subunit [Isosphaeraceae bacterium]
MKVRMVSAAVGLTLGVALAASGQGPAATGTTTAQIETVPIELNWPDHYQVPVTLEPSRQARLIAPGDGVLRSLTAPIGKMVKEGDEIAQFDRAEALARQKIALAVVKERKAEVDAAKGSRATSFAVAIAEARVEAAEAQADLAKLELDRCTLRAPFPGRVMATPVAAGAYVPKGTEIAQIADVSSLNVLIPVSRTAVKERGTIDMVIEGKTVKGKVMAILPLEERYAVLRELVTPWVGAWVSVSNSGQELEPGQQVRNAHLPTEPITNVPGRAVHGSSGGRGTVQVIRAGYVRDVPVQVMGTIGTERVQVSGPLRPNDSVVVSTSHPLLADTLVHFGGEAIGSAITPPSGGAAVSTSTTPTSPRIAPIGAPNQVPGGTAARPSATSSRPATPSPAPAPARPAAKPARPATTVVPF